MLVPQRSLKLIDLTGWAHKRLKLTGRLLVECEPTDYPTIALWGERFHAAPGEPDGIYWRSRQYDKAHAFILFGDRIAADDLHIVYDETIGLWQGDGLDEVLTAAEQADVTILV